MATFDNDSNVIDSRDVIERIEELEAELADDDGNIPSLDSLSDDDERRADVEELEELKRLQSEAESSPDWQHGETLIRESYFASYIEELINDCYEMPKDMNSGAWPWRHMKIDYEAAADEAKADYFEVEYFGVTYLIRA